jgi:prevent-host-death family protein
MRALEVRARFGEVIDAAAGGDRIVIERSGHPIAAIVPLSDLDAVDPERVRQRQGEAFDHLLRLARRARDQGVPVAGDAAVRADRDRSRPG